MSHGWKLIGLVLALGLSLAAAPASASPWTKGALVDYLDLTPDGSQPALVHGLQGASDCTGCHAGAADEHFYPGNSWSGSMKANATRDPLFWAALDVANADLPGVGDFCLRCHTPTGWYAGRVRKVQDVNPVDGQVPAADLVDGADGCKLQGGYENGDVSGNDYQGIGCHFCHRLQAEGPGGSPALIDNARVWLDDSDCDGAGEPCRAGPYAYPAPLPGGGEFSAPPHAWKQSHFIGSAEACGACHDVTSPITEQGAFKTLKVPGDTPAGTDTGIPFPIERTYSEWLASDFSAVLFRDDLESRDAQQRAERVARGANCRDCHMPQAQPSEPDGDVLACFFGPTRNDYQPLHAFVGGNTWVPNILKGEFSGLGRSEAFDWTIARATEMLSERSARIAASAQWRESSDVLDVQVQVTNLTGHKLPTGYSEGRRMWLQVEVRDAGDALLWSNGGWDPATGELSQDAQTRIYEVKQGIWNPATGTCDTTDSQGREAFHFVLNDCVAKDNRIPPAGFRGGDSLELRPVGQAYAETAPGSGRLRNVDTVDYAIPGLSVGAELSVRARLVYQTASKDYIEFLRNQAVERGFPAENDLCAGEPNRPFNVGPQHRSRGQYVHELWSNPAYGRSPPVTMAEAVTPVAPASVP